MALCPKHNDHDPSLSIDDEKGVFFCHACQWGGSLFISPKTLTHSHTKQKAIDNKRKIEAEGVETPFTQDSHTSHTLTLAEYAQEKGLSEDFLRGLGVSEIPYNGSNAVRIPYFNELEILKAAQIRLSINGANNFRWRSGDKPIPYGLNRLQDAREDDYIIIVEGPSDAQTLWQCGFHAIGIPGVNTWRAEWVAYIEPFGKIYFVREPDQGGDTLFKTLQGLPERLTDKLFVVNLSPHKDPSELYISDREKFKYNLQAALDAATPMKDISQAEANRRANEAMAEAKDLLFDPELMTKLRSAIRSAGYAGDTILVELGFVSLTSRLLQRPLNLAYVGPSASGKNASIDIAIEFVPPHTYHLEKAGSALALIYSGEEFKHRVVIVAEADSIPDEGPAASAVRALAEDNCMMYDVVERDPNTGKFQTRRICKEGPTGLITTSIKSLKHQLGTRLIEATTIDTPDQTKHIMDAHARAVNENRDISKEQKQFQALQIWLETAGTRSISIPYANVLAGSVPACAVRMRRDFRQLLTVIQTVAMIHQCQREKDDQGRIIATIEDYEISHNLCSGIFNSVINEGISEAIRDVVNDVADNGSDSYGKIAGNLNLSRETIRYRVGRATSKGWLKRDKDKKIILGDPLPDKQYALPPPEEIKAKLCECVKGVSTPPAQADEENTIEKQRDIDGCVNVSTDSGRSRHPLPPPYDAQGRIEVKGTFRKVS